MNNWATLEKIGVIRKQMKNQSKNGWNWCKMDEIDAKLMKLMQNGLFIDEIWVKIVVETLSYHWN